ncbi:hypothetical protein H0E87_018352, partial [Populus deltoides]
MATSIYPLQFLFLLTISATLHKSSSYLCTSSAIINPAKVKPRSLSLSLFLKRSAVAANLSGKSKLSQDRTSSGMFISKAKDPIVAGAEDKIATWTFSQKVNVDRGEHRLATVLVYLTDVEKGGEMVFPSAEEHTRRKAYVSHEDVSECARNGIAVKPRRGDALLFFSLHPTAVPDISSLHAGCPVIEGEKWSATKWIHVDSSDKNVEAGGNCTDQNESCERWAALGERTKNTEYTVGSPDLPGYCRRSSK